jgi:NAD-dependent SIR2 family protein deacetylase
MGIVDLGLLEFRGSGGFWNAHPARGIASPDSFKTDPRLAWAFYGHRLPLYLRTEPQDGYRILRRWADERPRWPSFSPATNAHLPQAGFRADRICGVHGSNYQLQCVNSC